MNKDEGCEAAFEENDRQPDSCGIDKACLWLQLTFAGT